MQINDLFVVAMGIGTVFVVLILIIALCYLLGLICRSKAAPEKIANEVPASEAAVTNRAELSAVISSVIAEYSETEASAIRILSIKKI